MSEILAFISPDADREMRERLALLMCMRGIKVTNDMKQATIVVMPGDEPKLEESLRKEKESKEYKHLPDIQDIVIQTNNQKKKQKKSFAHSTTLKKYNCTKATYSQRFFKRTTCK